MQKDRILYIDWLRIIAALMVVMIHTSGVLYLDKPSGTVDYYLGFWNMEMVRSAVPLFFMISGTLLLRPRYDASPRKMVYKALKTLVLMLIWSLVYALVYVHPLSIKALIFTTIKGPFHFWFFEYLIGLYLLTPIFKAIVEYKDGLLERYYLALFLFFGIVITSLQSIPFCHKWIMDVSAKVNVEWLGHAGYFFLGHYLSQKQIKLSPWIIAGIYVTAVLAQGWCTGNITLLASSDKFWWLVCIEAASIYAFFVVLKDTKFINNSKVTKFAALAMGIYILHPLISENIPEMFQTASFYLLDIIVVFFGSMLVSWLIMKIPVVGKWLLSI